MQKMRIFEAHFVRSEEETLTVWRFKRTFQRDLFRIWRTFRETTSEQPRFLGFSCYRSLWRARRDPG